MEIVEFLKACLDEDERIARAACEGGEGRWHPLGDRVGGSVAGDHEGYHVAFDEGYPTLEQATHIAAHDPARVLRDIDRDRRTLIRCQEAMFAASPMLVHFAKQTLREMALSFSDRPGFAEAIASAE